MGGAIVGIGSAYLFTNPYDQSRVAISLGKRDEDYVIDFSFQF